MDTYNVKSLLKNTLKFAVSATHAFCVKTPMNRGISKSSYFYEFVKTPMNRGISKIVKIVQVNS